MKELRDIKLDLLFGKQNPIVNLFNQITKDIKIINCEVYHKEGIEFIYYKDDQWIFYQDCNNEEFWCNHDIYWSLFESNFDLEYEDIQSITKYLVEEALKREVDTPGRVLIPTTLMVEEALKREVDTPGGVTYTNTSRVEEALKRELNTTYWIGSPTIDSVIDSVEQALKRELGTPVDYYTKYVDKVGEALKREVGKPEADPLAGFFHVEDATPNKMTSMIGRFVERYIKKNKL